MAESDASRLLELSKSVQAPTPKWQKTVKVRTPRFTTPQAAPCGAKPTVCYTSTEKRRLGRSSGMNRHHRSIQEVKLEREDGDRFIPNRTLTDINYASQQMLHGEPPGDEKSDEEDAPKSMYEFGSSCKRKVKGIQPPSSGRSFSTSRKPKIVKDIRKVPAEPEKILDAPDVMDDFYINPLAWSIRNQLAIGLGGQVYLWNADDGSVLSLTELSRSSEYISSVGWGKKGTYLAVGTSYSRIQIWDINKQQKLREIRTGKSCRIGCVDWNSFNLASGCEDGTIYVHDVRQKDALVTSTQQHTMEVCGLKWTTDGRFLASGGNDNAVYIWNLPTTKDPVHRLTEHKSAVKALAWCPWNSSLLATGGGNHDRTIKLWNVLNGTCQRTVDVESPVCSIIWSEENRELASGHGMPHNYLSLWKYPCMSKVADLKGHTGRIIQLASSPDGCTVASLGADETLRIWRCFDSCKSKQQKPTKTMEQLSNSQIFRQAHERLR